MDNLQDEAQQSNWMQSPDDLKPTWMQSQSEPEPKKYSFPPMTVENAGKIISGFSNRPDWLGNRKTRHAAESVYSMAGDVIAKHIQLERLNTDIGFTATENKLGNEMAQYLSELPGEVAAKYLQRDENGKRPIDSLGAFGAIKKDWDTHVLPGIKAEKEAALKTRNNPTATERLNLARNDPNITPKNKEAIEIAQGLKPRPQPVKEGDLSADVKSQLTDLRQANALITKEVYAIRRDATNPTKLTDKENALIKEYQTKFANNQAKAAELRNPKSEATAPKGIRVQNKKTGQFGTQMPDGSIIPD